MKRAVGLALLTLSAACNEAPDEPGSATGGIECVPVREGTLYRVENGLLVPLEALRPARTTPGGGLSAPGRLVSEVNTAGFSWLSLDASGFEQGFAILAGEAPSVAAKDAASARAESAIRANPEGADLVLVDGVSVRGSGEPVGAPVSRLGNSPSASACTGAYEAILNDRTVRFVTGTSEISRESRALIDALAAATLRCEDHEIEVAANTAGGTSAQADRTVTQKRALAVVRAMIARGVAPERLKAVGLGAETAPDNQTGEGASGATTVIDFRVRARP